MIVRTHTPAPPLSRFVQTFWLYDGFEPDHAMERVLPTGTMQVVINLRQDRIRVYDRGRPGRCRCLSGAILSGAHSESGLIDTAGQASTIGVHFRPGGAFPFIDRPAGDLRDADVSLDTLWGPTAGDLREQLVEAATPEAKFARLAAALRARLRRSATPHPAVSGALDMLRDAAHTPTIGELAERVGLSHRRFIEAFRREVGLTPKLFCRIRRLQAVVQRIAPVREVDWGRVALSCGYFDQSHLIRDFWALAGMKPTTYLRRRSGHHRNHVALPG